jgi:hypothetical protein
MRVNVGDIELHVREEVSPGGHGRPIVLLHEGRGLDGSVWFPAEIPNTGHMVLDEAPVEALSALRSFFARV